MSMFAVKGSGANSAARLMHAAYFARLDTGGLQHNFNPS